MVHHQTLTLLPHCVNFLVARWYCRCAMQTSPTPSRILFLSSASRSSISLDGVSFSTSSSVIGICCSMHSFSASQYYNIQQSTIRPQAKFFKNYGWLEKNRLKFGWLLIFFLKYGWRAAWKYFSEAKTGIKCILELGSFEKWGHMARPSVQSLATV